jgi:hypothetical protein
MSLTETEYRHDDGDPYIVEMTHTASQIATSYGHIPYRQFRISVASGEVLNDGIDTEVVTVEVVSGLQRARGETPADVLQYDGDAVIFIDGVETSKPLTDGKADFEITTTKPAGAAITVRATALANSPTDQDSETIEVLQ